MNLLFFLTLGLLFGVGLVFAQTDRQDVMGNWNTRRCDPFVVIAANLYKPESDPRSSTTFAAENLKFCTNKIIQEVFTVAINPFLSLLKNQLGAFNVIQESLAAVKQMFGNFFRSFSKILDGIYQRFIGVAFQFRKTFVRFLTAMNRAFGIAIATLYAGLSTVVGIQNLYDAVIKIVIIVLGILAGLIILLFIAFFPVIPIILTTIGVLVAGGIAGAAGFSGVFCFSPQTVIQTQRGPVKLQDIKLQDVLSDGGIVEGILRVNGSQTPLYKLDNTIVSGDHLVYYEPLASWILVKEHPSAILQVKREPTLICLNTSTREIPIQNTRFRDWEEIPIDRPELQTAWNGMIQELLGSEKTESTGNQYPILSGAWKLMTPTGKIALRDCFLGIKVQDETGGWTTLLGIYEGLEEVDGSKDAWASNSIWWKTEKGWTQKSAKDKSKERCKLRRGFHLITSSGTFRIWDERGRSEGIRDFTEIGMDRIAETYEWMKKNL